MGVARTPRRQAADSAARSRGRARPCVITLAWRRSGGLLGGWRTCTPTQGGQSTVASLPFVPPTRAPPPNLLRSGGGRRHVVVEQAAPPPTHPVRTAAATAVGGRCLTSLGISSSWPPPARLSFAACWLHPFVCTPGLQGVVAVPRRSKHVRRRLLPPPALPPPPVHRVSHPALLPCHRARSSSPALLGVLSGSPLHPPARRVLARLPPSPPPPRSSIASTAGPTGAHGLSAGPGACLVRVERPAAAAHPLRAFSAPPWYGAGSLLSKATALRAAALLSYCCCPGGEEHQRGGGATTTKQ